VSQQFGAGKAFLHFILGRQGTCKKQLTSSHFSFAESGFSIPNPIVVELLEIFVASFVSFTSTLAT
jgi:hypothetical protein